MGLRRARAQAQRELNDQADRFENVIPEIHAEMRGMRDELARLQMLDNAILAERDPTMVERREHSRTTAMPRACAARSVSRSCSAASARLVHSGHTGEVGYDLSQHLQPFDVHLLSKNAP